MPQMAPLSWLTLFIMFSLSLILFCTMNYFLYNPSTPTSATNLSKTNSFDWKW